MTVKQMKVIKKQFSFEGFLDRHLGPEAVEVVIRVALARIQLTRPTPGNRETVAAAGTFLLKNF